jgi:hypothetical protein
VSIELGELKQFTRKFMGDRLSSNAIFSQDEYLTAVFNDMVIPDIVGRYPWSWKYIMESGVIGQGKWKFQMPATYQDIALLILHSGEVSNTYKMGYKNPQRFFEMIPDPELETSGKAEFFTKINREIWFDRPLDETMALRVLAYRRFPRVETDDETFSYIEGDRHMVLAYGAAAFCFLTVEDTEHAKPWLTIYQTSIEQMWSLDNTQEVEEYTLGKFNPHAAMDRILQGNYWQNPFILTNP